MPEWLITSLADLTPAGAVLLAIALFSGSLVPFFLLVEAEHLTPRWLRDAPQSLAPARTAVRDAVLDTAALVLLLTTSPNGATHV
ncbi:hypothetical protein [Streptomyces sp. NPDC048200]|uniref:hypothetical protein n=1 Tax=Streptomyces sp. NPDC048200 TaxID=3365512 RepID=UPI003715B519